MHDRFGICGPAHEWFASYISDRSLPVTVNQFSSLVSLMCGILQGSVLRPVEFIMYTEDLVSVTDNVPLVSPHFYADE